MGTSWSDAADAARDNERAEAALTEALAEAEKIAARFTVEQSGSPLQPEVSVDLDIGGDDQPLFVFSVDVDLADDLAADDYPLKEIQELTSTLRSQIAASTVVGWAWLVTAGTKTGAAH
ncbi:MAG: hypothetical protein WBA45_06200 [Microthrixaceae bacterium]